ncbi:MAG: peptidoglycan DD-metalloendopeptidase family protein, partial [bacterium]|nr:peptidoglycan DD-metalloendopeptidase family protein [bacterium]
QWKYEPYIVDGKPFPVRFTVVVQFNLHGRSKMPGSQKKNSTFTGEPMDFNFKKAALKDILILIAKISDINIVLDPGLGRHTVACDLKKVPWDQALSWMLQLNGLDMLRKGNVLRIMKGHPDNQELKRYTAGKTYVGEPMNLNRKEADLVKVLNLLAKKGAKNISIAPGITGFVTCNLEKVPWDQTMDLILQLNGLEMKQEGKTIRIFKPRSMVRKAVNTLMTKLSGIPSTLPIIGGYLKEGFGPRKNYKTGKEVFHKGVDISAKRGTKVIAPADGVVTEVTTKKGYGKMIVIDHQNGYTTRYGELDSFNVKKGDSVKKGKVIGLVGNSGSNGPTHLHYEVRFKEKPINPLTVLQEKQRI